MTASWTFSSAADYWRAHRETATESQWDRLASAEAYLLDHSPRSALEVETLFEVLLDQGPGGRCDGRDVEALARLRDYVGSLNQSGATPG